MDGDGTTFAGMFLKERNVPDVSQEANHGLVHVLATEKLLELANEGGSLPVRNVLAKESAFHFVRRHTINQSLTSGRLWSKFYLLDRTQNFLTNVHRCRFASCRLAYQNDVKVGENSKATLWDEALLSKQRADYADRRPRMKVRGRLTRLGKLVVIREEVLH